MPTNTNESKFIKEIVDLIRSGLSKEELTEKLQPRHWKILTKKSGLLFTTCWIQSGCLRSSLS